MHLNTTPWKFEFKFCKGSRDREHVYSEWHLIALAVVYLMYYIVRVYMYVYIHVYTYNHTIDAYAPLKTIVFHAQLYLHMSLCQFFLAAHIWTRFWFPLLQMMILTLAARLPVHLTTKSITLNVSLISLFVSNKTVAP